MRCRICNGELDYLGRVPFERNSFEVPILLPNVIEYYKCTKCYSITAPDMLDLTVEQLGQTIYNKDYIKFDPHYTEIRPKTCRDILTKVFTRSNRFKHLDYGSGSGLLVKLLKDTGWDSTGYDPYSEALLPEGQFNLVTAFEVFEHSTNIDATIKDIKNYLKHSGVLMFSTLLATRDTDISWEYILPRNGHINIQSAESMKILAKNNGLFFSSINDSIHIMQSTRNRFKELLRK